MALLLNLREDVGEEILRSGLCGRRFHGGISPLQKLRGQLQQEPRGVAGHHLSIAFAAGAVAQGEIFSGTGQRHIEETALFIQSAFVYGAAMREQAIFQPDNMDIGELQTLAAVHGDEREGTLDLFLLSKFASGYLRCVDRPLRRFSGFV